MTVATQRRTTSRKQLLKMCVCVCVPMTHCIFLVNTLHVQHRVFFFEYLNYFDKPSGTPTKHVLVTKNEDEKAVYSNLPIIYVGKPIASQ